MKRWLILPILLILLLAGLLIGPNFVDWNKYKQQAETQIATIAGLDVNINGDISLGLIPTPRLYVENVLVNDPTGGDQPLASLKQLDIRVAMMPLIMGGNIVVNSFKLEEPMVRLSKNASGRFNFMTPEIEALMNKDEDEGEETVGEEKSPVAVIFETASIEKGYFYYADAASETPIEVKDVNLKLKADTLSGPFESSGSLLYADKPINYDIKTGELDKDTQTTSLNLKGDAIGARFSYAGTVSLNDEPEIQGEISLMVESLSEFMELNKMDSPPAALQGEAGVKGVVTASASRAVLKDTVITLAGNSFKGEGDIALDPINVTGRFTAEKPLNLDQFVENKSRKEKGSENFDPANLSASLPQTLELPVIGNINLEFIFPTLIYAQQEIKNASFKIEKEDKGFIAELIANQIPGDAVLQAGGALNFSEISTSPAANTQIYSNPSLMFSMKGQSENIGDTIKTFTGMSDIPVVSTSRKALFDITGQLKNRALIIDKGIINLDEKAFSLSGGLSKPSNTERSVLDIKIVADRFDFDTVTGKQQSQQATEKSSDVLSPLKTLSLPYDVRVDLTVNNASAQGYNVEGLRAKGAILQNSLLLDDVGARNFAGSSLSVSGGISDLKNLSEIQINASLNSPDPYKLAEALKLNTATWPQNLGAVNANIKAVGTIEAMDTSATIGALGGDVIFKGVISKPLTALSINNVALQIKHPNMAQGFKNLGTPLPAYKSFAGPMDVYANVNMDGKITSLSGIQGKLAGTTMSGDVKYDASGAVPNVIGDLEFGELILQSASSGSLQRSAPSSSNSSSSRAGGKWSSDPINVDFLRSMNADFSVSADRLLYETWDMKSPDIKITLQNGTMSIDNLNAGLFDGNIAMKGSLISSAKDKPLSMKANAQISNINMGALAQSLSGSGRIKAEGDVSLNFDVNSTGLSQRDLVQGLNGSADLKGNNVIMKGFDLAGLGAALMDSAKPLDRLQQIVSSTTSGGETAFDTINGAYTISNGIVRIGTMEMNGPSAQISSKGSADLPRWYIDTVHTITLKNAKEVAPFDVEIKGSLDNPGNTFGKGMFDTILRNKVKDKLLDKAPDLLGDDVTNKLQQFGILPQRQAPQPIEPVNDNSADSVGSEVDSRGDALPAEPDPTPAPAPTPTREQQQEEAIKGLLNNFLR